MISNQLHIIMPVKDSIETTEQAVRAIIRSGHTFTLYNDYSTPENTARLQTLRDELGFRLVNLADEIDHPSPNYRYVLIQAEHEALAENANLVIVESDVIVGEHSLERLTEPLKEGIGLVAAVTVNEQDEVNFPYEYAHNYARNQAQETRKRLSFCCTLLSYDLLRMIDFEQLDPTKNWYDVKISHLSVEKGMRNILMMNNAVVHKPHSSRPWKQLKYTNPLLYYWRKITQRKDKI